MIETPRDKNVFFRFVGVRKGLMGNRVVHLSNIILVLMVTHLTKFFQVLPFPDLLLNIWVLELSANGVDRVGYY